MYSRKKLKLQMAISFITKIGFLISLDAYNDKKKEIIQYLGVNGEIDVKPWGKKRC